MPRSRITFGVVRNHIPARATEPANPRHISAFDAADSVKMSAPCAKDRIAWFWYCFYPQKGPSDFVREHHEYIRGCFANTDSPSDCDDKGLPKALNRRRDQIQARINDKQRPLVHSNSKYHVLKDHLAKEISKFNNKHGHTPTNADVKEAAQMFRDKNPDKPYPKQYKYLDKMIRGLNNGESMPTPNTGGTLDIDAAWSELRRSDTLPTDDEWKKFMDGVKCNEDAGDKQLAGASIASRDALSVRAGSDNQRDSKRTELDQATPTKVHSDNVLASCATSAMAWTPMPHVLQSTSNDGGKVLLLSQEEPAFGGGHGSVAGSSVNSTELLLKLTTANTGRTSNSNDDLEAFMEKNSIVGASANHDASGSDTENIPNASKRTNSRSVPNVNYATLPQAHSFSAAEDDCAHLLDGELKDAMECQEEQACIVKNNHGVHGVAAGHLGDIHDNVSMASESTPLSISVDSMMISESSSTSIGTWPKIRSSSTVSASATANVPMDFEQANSDSETLPTTTPVTMSGDILLTSAFSSMSMRTRVTSQSFLARIGSWIRRGPWSAGSASTALTVVFVDSISNFESPMTVDCTSRHGLESNMEVLCSKR